MAFLYKGRGKNMLKRELIELSEEHQRISHLLIQQNIRQLERLYGNKERAVQRLRELEYRLNYRS